MPRDPPVISAVRPFSVNSSVVCMSPLSVNHVAVSLILAVARISGLLGRPGPPVRARDANTGGDLTELVRSELADRFLAERKCGLAVGLADCLASFLAHRFVPCRVVG